MTKSRMRKLRPLLKSWPRTAGDTFVADDRFVICMACGSMGKRMMLRKHKPKCSYVAHYEALKVLAELLK